MAVACIALGSNLGDRSHLLDRAVAMLGESAGVCVVARSTNHPTKAVGGPPGQPDFLNAAVVVEADLPPEHLLACLQRIELAMGRPPPAQREPMGPRSIDLDLLLYDDVVSNETELVLPHPRMHQRRFVLAPLAEVAPDRVHPLLGLTVAQMLDRLDEAGPNPGFETAASD